MVKFQGPTAKWLDRPINDDHVDELVAVLQDNPCAMVNSQLWLGICQIPRDGIKEVNDVKGCKIISHLLMGYIGKSLWKSKFNLYFQAVRTVCLWQFHNFANDIDRKGPRLPPMAISDGRKEHGTGRSSSVITTIA